MNILLKKWEKFGFFQMNEKLFLINKIHLNELDYIYRLQFC